MDMDISWRHFLPHSGLPVISTINCLTLDVIRWETNALKSFNGRRPKKKKKYIYLALNCLRCLLSHIHHQLICFSMVHVLCVALQFFDWRKFIVLLYSVVFSEQCYWWISMWDFFFETEKPPQTYCLLFQ